MPARATNAVLTFTNFPNVVSNTYNGIITLQISGLTNGVTNVVVQKFIDVNTNGIIDSGDPLVQQFQLTLGQTRVFTDAKTGNPVVVTNAMPGDISSVPGQMTVPLNFQNGDFFQNLVARYLYRISSPSGLFAPVTNSFVVTNTFYSSLATGIVVNANTAPTYAPVTNCIVLACVYQGGSLNVTAGTVATTNGGFSLRIPPGDYFLLATKTNFLEESALSYGFSLVAKQTNGLGNLYLTPASTNVTGKFINAANSNGLAGVSGLLVDTTNDYSFFFTDTNGNFSAAVTMSNTWGAQVSPFAAAFQGILTWQTNVVLNITNKTVSFTNALPPENAIFYGVVSNSAAEPLPGVYMDSSDSANHQSMGMTDQHGKYFLGALAGTNQWQFAIDATKNPGITNYVFSPGYVEAIDLQTNEAIQQNFSLLLAPYTISGTVSDADGNPIVGAVIFATNGTYEAFGAVSGSGGAYSLDVSPGSWTVGIVPASLQNLGYTNFPANQTTTVSDADPYVNVNFTIVTCNEIEILTTNLPDAIVGDYYQTNLAADSCQNITNWSPAFGVTLTSLYDQTNVTYPAGTRIYSDPQMIGYEETYFSFGCSGGVLETPTNCTIGSMPVDGNEHYAWANIQAQVIVTGPITNTTQIQFGTGSGVTVWSASPTTQNADGTYTTTVTLGYFPVGGGSTYYSGGFNLRPGAIVYKTSPPQSNTVGSVTGDFHSIPTVGNSMIVASSLPYTNLNNSPVWITSGTNTGQYLISAYGPQSTNLPPGLGVLPDGTIEGTPTATSTNGTFNFSVAAQDSAGNIAVQPFSIFVYPGTAITGPSSSSQTRMLESSNIFEMHVTSVEPGFGYTVLMSTNLASPNWVPIYTTNAVNTNSFNIPDTAATNSARYYRLEISPPGS